eukprot:scaffold273087_cov45-Tisochrysis_lutea.AAC.1
MGVGRAALYIGVLAVTPDALMLRVIRESGASTVVILIWRYLLSSSGLALTAIWLRGGSSQRHLQMSNAPFRWLCATAVLQSLTNMGFAVSLILVEPSRALILISLAPFWAVFLCRMLLGEVVDPRTLCTITCAFCAVGLVFGPALMGQDERSNGIRRQSASELDILPAATGLIMAAFVVSTRQLTQRYPIASGPIIPALGTLLSLLIVLGFAVYTKEPSLLPPATRSSVIAIGLNGIAVMLYYIGIALAAREVPPEETAVVLLLETALAPVWIYVWFSDVPSIYTIAGGLLLITTLIVKEASGAQHVKPSRAREPNGTNANAPECTPCLSVHTHTSSSVA